jgi:hypothetical protein
VNVVQTDAGSLALVPAPLRSAFVDMLDPRRAVFST